MNAPSIEHWSFSKLRKSGCMVRLHNYVTQPKVPHGGDAEAGRQAHANLELYINTRGKQGEVLPKTRTFLNSIISGAHEVHAEMRLEATVDGIPLLGFADLVAFKRQGGTNLCQLVDFKRNPGLEDMKQLQTYAAIIKELRPEVEMFSGQFFFTELEYFTVPVCNYAREFIGSILWEYKAAAAAYENAATVDNFEPNPSQANCHPELCPLAKEIEIPQLNSVDNAIELAERLQAWNAVAGKAKRLIETFMQDSCVPFLPLKKGKVQFAHSKPSMKFYKTAATDAEMKVYQTFLESQRAEIAEPVEQEQGKQEPPQLEPSTEPEPCPFGDDEPVQEPVTMTDQRTACDTNILSNGGCSHLWGYDCSAGPGCCMKCDLDPCPHMHRCGPSLEAREKGQGGGSGITPVGTEHVNLDETLTEKQKAQAKKDLDKLEKEKNLGQDAYKNAQETGYYHKRKKYPVVCVAEKKGFICRYQAEEGFKTIRNVGEHKPTADEAVTYFEGLYKDTDTIGGVNKHNPTEQEQPQEQTITHTTPTEPDPDPAPEMTDAAESLIDKAMEAIKGQEPTCTVCKKCDWKHTFKLGKEPGTVDIELTCKGCGMKVSTSYAPPQEEQPCMHCLRTPCICEDSVKPDYVKMLREKYFRLYPNATDADYLSFKENTADRAECYGYTLSSTRVHVAMNKIINKLYKEQVDGGAAA